jgi:DNA-binding response OmpR family regulator
MARQVTTEAIGAEAQPRGATMVRLCRILVIEDNELVLGVVNEAIAIEGYQVELVRPPVDHVEDIDFAEFDVAIIDLMLPRGLDGFSLARRAAQCGIGVILMSGDHAQFDRATQSGHAFLAKPFRLITLMRLLEEVLAKTGAECERSRDPVPA